jgi:alkanesulfonate monooxygenase SsuD/methylene tetrahydromethanopterin reductase-like flavin-dependent oxidoreductase (luciferase family)
MQSGVGIDDGLRLAPGDQRTLVQEAARLGYDSIWRPASAAGRSAFHSCVQWWQASTEVVADGLRMGISVVPFPAWRITTLAAEAATVSELTNGRFVLGIGLGGYASSGFRRQLGLDDLPPVSFTRDFTRALRALLRGETVDADGVGVSLHGVKLGLSAPTVPVYLGALGPQMLRVAGQVSDGVLPNWSSPEEIARMREHVAADIPIAHYIRVCIDEDADAARRAFASNMLGYALARPGQRKDQGYRAHFARMGFDEVLTDLEARREAGAPDAELVDRIPADLLLKVGYFGKPSGAPAALRRLSHGHDEAMVRLIATRPGDLSGCLAAVRACEPTGWAR